MKKVILGIAICLLFGVLRLAAQEEQTFKGKITECMCSGAAGNVAMSEENAPTARCTLACGKSGARYVLADPENQAVYQLDNQRKPKAFAGQNVVVIGPLDKSTGTIHIQDIFRALPPKVTQAKSVSIVCDACLRGMAAANQAASQGLADWGRFDVLADRRKADLIILFSANPYLGDYGVRDGPDTRQVHVDITYMNVIDPRTGESLWGDSRQWGSWFVAKATKDLIVEFREQLEAGDGQAERLLSVMDKYRDGEMTKEEFLRLMDAEFDRLDTDKNGKLDANELRQLRGADIGK
jgi:hypothetical protein